MIGDMVPSVGATLAAIAATSAGFAADQVLRRRRPALADVLRSMGAGFAGWAVATFLAFLGHAAAGAVVAPLVVGAAVALFPTGRVARYARENL